MTATGAERRVADGLSVRDDGAVVRLVLDGPDGHPLGPDLLDALAREVRRHAEAGAARALVVTGAGGCFSRGRHNPVEEIGTSEDVRSRRALVRAAGALFHVLAAAPVPIVAAVEGPAVGIGCALVTACDLAYATRDATFELPELDLGLAPFLALAAGLRTGRPADVLDLLCRRATLDADGARRIGLVNHVAEDPADLRATVGDVAARLGRQSADVVHDLKRLTRAAQGNETLLATGEAMLARFILQLELDRPVPPDGGAPPSTKGPR